MGNAGRAKPKINITNTYGQQDAHGRVDVGGAAVAAALAARASAPAPAAPRAAAPTTAPTPAAARQVAAPAPTFDAEAYARAQAQAQAQAQVSEARNNALAPMACAFLKAIGVDADNKEKVSRVLRLIIPNIYNYTKKELQELSGSGSDELEGLKSFDQRSADPYTRFKGATVILSTEAFETFKGHHPAPARYPEGVKGEEAQELHKLHRLLGELLAKRFKQKVGVGYRHEYATQAFTRQIGISEKGNTANAAIRHNSILLYSQQYTELGEHPKLTDHKAFDDYAQKEAELDNNTFGLRENAGAGAAASGKVTKRRTLLTAELTRRLGHRAVEILETLKDNKDAIKAGDPLQDRRQGRFRLGNYGHKELMLWFMSELEDSRTDAYRFIFEEELAAKKAQALERRAAAAAEIRKRLTTPAMPWYLSAQCCAVSGLIIVAALILA